MAHSNPQSPPARKPSDQSLDPPVDSIFYPPERYNRFVRHARRGALRFLNQMDSVDADDLATRTAEAVLAMVQDGASDRRSANLLGYLTRAVKNAFLDALRAAKNSSRLGAKYHLQHEEHNARTRIADVMLEHKELNHAVRVAVRNLPQPERSYVIARHLADMTYKEIAARYGAPASTVQKCVHRAYAMLMPALAPHWPLSNDAPRTPSLAAYEEASQIIEEEEVQ